jgi:methionine biosynthesis protein MetW
MTGPLRADYQIILDAVAPGARVLDVGCGDGELLCLLRDSKGAQVRGLELSQAGVNACVQRGLAVVQGDADADLALYPDGAFDVVVLSQTIQATRRPLKVLQDMRRIGRRAFVSFPNFAHWRVRLGLLLSGRMPLTDTLPDAWHTTENIHLCSLRDFEALARDAAWRVGQVHALSRDTARPGQPHVTAASNLFAEAALFDLSGQ